MSRAVFALLLLLVAGAAIWLSPSLRAAPEPRIALVIGNADYGSDIGRLKNPVNDARLMDSTLRGVGFQVVRLENANRKQMRQAIADFGRRLTQAGPTAVGMFYYAGHGFQTSGRNWLVPVGAVVNSEADAEDETVRADYVLEQMDIARNQLNIVILDACRNNPFARSFRSSQRGLAPVQAPSNSVVGYATAPDDVAADGDDGNSPYTKALAQEIGSSSDRIEIVMTNVTANVKRATANRQSPFVSSSLDREFRFNPQGVAQAPSAAMPPPPTTQTSGATGSYSATTALSFIPLDHPEISPTSFPLAYFNRRLEPFIAGKRVNAQRIVVAIGFVEPKELRRFACSTCVVGHVVARLPSIPACEVQFGVPRTYSLASTAASVMKAVDESMPAIANWIDKVLDGGGTKCP
ncbi:MAG: caspase family protein [Alphaproteobacteria bacterium]|nr:caspase family protein [Alphaproteobacteria bacterium]